MVKNHLTLSANCCLKKDSLTVSEPVLTAFLFYPDKVPAFHIGGYNIDQVSDKNKNQSVTFKRKVLFAEFLRCAIFKFFELSIKKRKTFISDLITNITYGSVRFKQQVACHIDPVLVQKEKEWFIHYFTEESGKGFLRHINHL